MHCVVKKNHNAIWADKLKLYVNKVKLTGTKTKEEMVCQFRFVSLDETLDWPIPIPRL